VERQHDYLRARGARHMAAQSTTQPAPHSNTDAAPALRGDYLPTPAHTLADRYCVLLSVRPSFARISLFYLGYRISICEKYTFGEFGHVCQAVQGW